MTETRPAFIDAHHHLWEPQTLEYGWLRQIGEPKPFGDPSPIQRDYTKDEFWPEASAQGALASVHIQADGALPDPVSESQWIIAQQSKAPAPGVPNAWVGFCNLRRTAAEAEATLAAHAALPGFRGIRHIVARSQAVPAMSFVPMELMEERGWQQNFALLARYQASFDLQLYPDQADSAYALLARHDDIPVIIDHCGGPYFLFDAFKRDAIPAAEPDLAHWAASIWKLAQLPQVSIKLSGLGMYHPQWSAQNCRVIFQTLLDAFGPKRLMLGSNFPVDKLFKSYADIVAIWDQWLEELSADEQAEIRVGAASRAYRLDL
jgi:predicted TIM-barrel fold metal-dependent hydrolase